MFYHKNTATAHEAVHTIDKEEWFTTLKIIEVTSVKSNFFRSFPADFLREK